MLIERSGRVVHQKPTKGETEGDSKRLSAALDVSDRRLDYGLISADLSSHLESRVKENSLSRLALVNHLLYRWKPDEV